MADSPAPRVKAMDELIQGLPQALEDWERHAHVSLRKVSPELKNRDGVLTKFAKWKRKNNLLGNHTSKRFKTLRKAGEAWLRAEIELAASRFGCDDNIEVVAGPIGQYG
jgi:hypothetical protein